MSLPDADVAFSELVLRMRGAVAFDAKFVGIYPGGAWLAERLAEAIPGNHPVGYIDASFYRDDYARKGLKPEVHSTRLPFEIEGARIVLVDDVLFSGRTVSAALGAFDDRGGRGDVRLAVLIDRGHRELPMSVLATNMMW